MEKLKQENAKLKMMLQLAMEEIFNTQECTNCVHRNTRGVCKKISICDWEWEHAAEAEKLLNGGESDA